MPTCSEVQRGVVLKSGDASQQQVAVTFDEHLSPTLTVAALDHFQDAGMLGTFFAVGSEATKYPNLTRSIINHGHELGNHSWTHPHLPKLRDYGFAELYRTQATIKDLTGVYPCLFRPPYGDLNLRVIQAATKLGLATVKWSAAANIFDASASHIANTVLPNMTAGTILLLHQITAHVNALPLILDGLANKGLVSVPAFELLGGDMG